MSLYDSAFYEEQAADSARSARRVLPPLLAALRPRAVVDVGCGVGTWLGVCRELGVEEILGLDGAYVDKERLVIPAESFRSTDLRSAWRLDRRYDLALCMEVAEHLPLAAADAFVERLTQLADCVLFSAAIPYQGGTGHQNENWPSFWSALFAKRAFELYDLVRPRFWDDGEVAYWYRQNGFVFARRDSAAAKALGAAPGPVVPLSAVHPESYLYAVSRGTVLSRERVAQDIEHLRRVTLGGAASESRSHDLDAFPVLALTRALKKMTKAALRLGGR